jgi:hypothetical protein
MVGRPTGTPSGAPHWRQPAYKPGSVGRDANATRDGHSSATPVARRLKRPTRAANPDMDPGIAPRAAPIRFCSRWGLPCRLRRRRRGALLPHRFTLAPAVRNAPRRSVLCGTFPGVTPAGCYPAPYVHGARTFLPGTLSGLAEAAVQPTDGIAMGAQGLAVKGSRPGRCPAEPRTAGSAAAGAAWSKSRHR